MFVGVWRLLAAKGPVQLGQVLGHFEGYVDMAQCLFAELFCGLSTRGQSRRGWTWMYKTLVGFNAGLLVEAGDGGGGAPVPGSCSWTSLFIFFTASAMWGKAAWR